MPSLSVQAITDYLSSLYHKPVVVRSVTGHSAREEGDDLKGLGYGSPLFLKYDVEGEPKKAMLETLAESSYGHDHFSDRARSILSQEVRKPRSGLFENVLSAPSFDPDHMKGYLHE